MKQILMSCVSIFFCGNLYAINYKSALCTLSSESHSYDKLARVKYLRKSVIKSLSFAPAMDSDYNETTYVDSCSIIDKKNKKYICFNPIDDLFKKASFIDNQLTVFTGENEKTIYNCKKEN